MYFGKSQVNVFGLEGSSFLPHVWLGLVVDHW